MNMHIEVIATLISDIRDTDVVTNTQADEIARIAAENLRHVHPRFDKAEFLVACGIEDPGPPDLTEFEKGIEDLFEEERQ